MIFFDGKSVKWRGDCGVVNAERILARKLRYCCHLDDAEPGGLVNDFSN